VPKIVEIGTLKSLGNFRSSASPELVELADHPRLDPRRVLRIYKKVGISTEEALLSALDSGHIETSTILLYHAHPLCESNEKFLVEEAGAERGNPSPLVQQNLDLRVLRE
jgi:DNA polymerase (family 10)